MIGTMASGSPQRAFITLLAVFLFGACASQPPAILTPETGELGGITHSRAMMPLTSGDATRGRKSFIALQCHACHRVAEDKDLPLIDDAWDGPVLHDLGKEPAEAVGWRIVTRTSLGPESVFESPMEEYSSAMTERELVDIIAYLRDPSSAGRD